MNTNNLAEVILFAMLKHGDQKYGNKPYIYHLIKVLRVLERFGITDSVLLKASLLHDILEDTLCTLEELTSKFGEEVAKTVYAVTDEPGANRKERKTKTYPKIRSNPRAIILKLADRIANVEETDDSLLSMYKKEHPEFVKALKVEPSITEWPFTEAHMWDHLGRLLA